MAGDGGEGKTPSLLIVDDEREACEGLQQFLALQGFLVRGVFSGEAGVAAVQAATPDLVLLDLQMPGIDGWETLARMRAIVPALRVVILTGSLSDPRVGRMTQQGKILGFLEKPLPIEDLPRRIRAFLSAAQPSTGAA